MNNLDENVQSGEINPQSGFPIGSEGDRLWQIQKAHRRLTTEEQSRLKIWYVFPRQAQERGRELMQKNQTEDLSPAEKAELEGLIFFPHSARGAALHMKLKLSGLSPAEYTEFEEIKKKDHLRFLVEKARADVADRIRHQMK